MNQDTSRPHEKTELQQAWMDKFRHEIVDTIDQQMFDTFDLLPDAYFESVTDADQLSQLKALMAIRICDIKQEIMLRSPDGRKITTIAQENYAGFLAQLIRRLPDDGDLIGAKIFSSRDRKFVIDIFEFGTETDESDSRSLNESEVALAESIVSRTTASPDRARRFVASYRPDHEILQSPDDLVQQFLALEETKDANDLTVVWEAIGPDLGASATDSNPPKPARQKRYAKVIVSSGGTTTRAIFTRAADFFAQYQIDIERAFCENVRTESGDKVALLTFRICIEQEAFEQARRLFEDDCSDVLDGDRLKSRLVNYLRVADEVVTYRESLNGNLVSHFGDLLMAELHCAFSRLAQHAVSFRYGIELTREQVSHRLLKHESATRALLHRFINRFEIHQTDAASIQLDTVSDATDRIILKVVRELVEGIDRCNLKQSYRRNVAMRIPGKLFGNPDRGEIPFAIFYVFGAGFDGFHLRFRDVSRGGMRLVRTRNHEHYLFESARAFDEVFRLASAQQLKNKDIAEGGAKAVVVLQPNVSPMLAGQKFVDGLLDLLVEDADSQPHHDELLYLGPDENVSNALIEWIVNRAKRRGYPFPNTIMSSKPATGINHKQFGVTSEGVAVFLHRALLENGFDPVVGSFTVKLTGGPDGDVGGNAIKILIREYAENVKIVGIADGSGAATDPKGLCHQELLRLVDEGLGIAHFNHLQLGPDGEVSALDSESAIARRNNLHFTIQSDVFVPAGGRPSAINANNWKKFLNHHGRPSSKIIVEGANLFVTEEARNHLARKGTVIVKDSSANKCGVICRQLGNHFQFAS